MAKEIVLSEQGEEQAETASTLWATESETEALVEDARKNDPYRLVCRQRGRHNYLLTAALTFSGITRHGLWVRRIPCHDCHAPGAPVKVERVELWDVRQYRGKITKAYLVVAYPN